MISLSTIIEATFTAISKQTGKKVYFKSKPSRDAAIKAGTHKLEKNKSQIKKVVGKPIFPTTQLPSPKRSEIPIKKIKHFDINTFTKGWYNRWDADKLPKVKKIINKVKNIQSEWLMELASTKSQTEVVDFLNNQVKWQDSVTYNNLKNMDKFLKKNPPPPIETDEFVYRGVSISQKAYNKLINDFNNPKTIKFPIQSFTTHLDIAIQFTDGGKAKPVMFRIKSQCSKLKGYYLNSAKKAAKNGKNIFGYDKENEILFSSNQKYVVDKIHKTKFYVGEHGEKDYTVIDMIQKCSTNEAEENNVLDLTDDKFYQAIMAYKPKK